MSNLTADPSHAIRVVAVVYRIRFPRSYHTAVHDVFAPTQTDAGQFLRRRGDDLRVGLRPEVIALEAEVLHAVAAKRRIRDEVGRPGFKNLNAPRAHRRIVDVDPVVGKIRPLLHDQRDGHEVAVSESSRRLARGFWRGRLDRLDDLTHWRRRHDVARAGHLLGAAVSASRDLPSTFGGVE